MDLIDNTEADKNSFLEKFLGNGSKLVYTEEDSSDGKRETNFYPEPKLHMLHQSSQN